MALYEQIDGRGVTRYYTQDLESWDDFSVIVDKVLRSLPAALVRQGDGPDARFAIVELDGFQVIFVHDDMMGNCFFSPNDDAAGVIRKVSALFSD